MRPRWSTRPALVPSRARALYYLNPLAVRGLRFSVGAAWGGDPPGALTLVSAAVALAFLASGLLYFAQVEHTFGDVI